MEIISQVDFFYRTQGGRPNALNLSPYAGKPFDCACDETHTFLNDPLQVLRELGGMRLVLRCPSSGSITCVKMEGFFRPTLKPLFGYREERET